VKIWRLVSEKFFEIKNILFWAPFTGGPDAKILFLSARRPPTAQKLGGQIPSIFYLQKPWKFCESLTNSFQDIRLFTVRAYRRDTIVSSTLKAESLYSDEYSFTPVSVLLPTCVLWMWQYQPVSVELITRLWVLHYTPVSVALHYLYYSLLYLLKQLCVNIAKFWNVYICLKLS